jgi:hypothetical protein
LSFGLVPPSEPEKSDSESCASTVCIGNGALALVPFLWAAVAQPSLGGDDFGTVLIHPYALPALAYAYAATSWRSAR